MYYMAIIICIIWPYYIRHIIHHDMDHSLRVLFSEINSIHQEVI